MTIRYLTIFSKVCETLNMTAAAEQLFITQPAVSACISELEAHYNVKLFERKRSKLFLTADGERLYHLSQKVLDAFHDLESIMGREAARRSIKIGVSLTVEGYIAPQILSNFTNTYAPSKPLELFSYPTSELEAALLDKKLDLVIAEGSLYSKQLTVVPLMQDELVFVCSRSSKLCPQLQAERPYLTARQISTLPLFVRDSQQKIFHTLYSRNIKIHSSNIFSSLEGIKQAVSYDLGLGIISKYALNDAAPLKIVEVEGGNLYRSIVLAYLSSSKRCPQTEALIQFIIDYTKKNQILY